jgi:hypothetical protein
MDFKIITLLSILPWLRPWCAQEWHRTIIAWRSLVDIANSSHQTLTSASTRHLLLFQTPNSGEFVILLTDFASRLYNGFFQLY